MKHPPRLRAHQSGYVILLATAVLVSAMLFVFLGQFDGRALRKARDDRTAQALAQAKEALIGYAVQDKKLPGSFPCPDVTNTGKPTQTVPDCQAYLGRIPWQTLGLGDIRDGRGDCLWYALSLNSLYRSALPVTSRSAASANTLNTATPGGLSLQNAAGNTISTRIVAIVFSAGEPLPGQNRVSAGAAVCGGTLNAADYLDIGPAPNAINNALGAANSIYVNAPRSATFNDTLLTITEQEVAEALARRVATDLKGFASNGLTRYYADNGHHLPCAAIINDGNPGGTNSGYFPYAVLMFDSDTNKWITRNNWYSQITSYAVSPDCASSGNLTVSITFAGQAPLLLHFP